MHAPAASVAGVAGPGQRAHRMAELLISAVPSGVTGWRSLALVDELTGATSSGSCPALTSMCWPWSTSSPARHPPARVRR